MYITNWLMRVCVCVYFLSSFKLKSRSTHRTTIFAIFFCMASGWFLYVRCLGNNKIKLWNMVCEFIVVSHSLGTTAIVHSFIYLYICVCLRLCLGACFAWWTWIYVSHACVCQCVNLFILPSFNSLSSLFYYFSLTV